MNIILVGMAGTGKSTVGKLLAEKLGFTFIDSDEQIVLDIQCTIAELFEKHGESHFRDLESQTITRLCTANNQIISTGGGAVLRAQNRETMTKNGIVVALTASAQSLIQRLQKDKKRPLIAGNAEVTVPQLLEQRKHAYDFATIQIHTDDLSVEEIANQIILQTNNI